jgi:glutathione S-transferase
MPVTYVSVEEAIQRPGLRMVVVGGVPSPWGEAAKGLLHIKRIPWAAVRLDYESEALKQWAGQRSGPVAILDKERPRSGWAEILLLAERLAPQPALVPADPFDRALMFGLSHELVGEGGLAWTRRLQLVHAGLQGLGGFPPPVAKYLAKKYGYTPELGAAAADRVASLLAMLAQRLDKGPYYVGDRHCRGPVQRDVHGDVPAAARGAVPDGRGDAEDLLDAPAGGRRAARAPRPHLPRPPRAAAFPLARRPGASPRRARGASAPRS